MISKRILPVVYFDLDGVLANMVKGALKVHLREDFPVRSIKWNFWEQLGIPEKDFWKPLDYYYWFGLEPYEDGAVLLEEVEKRVPKGRIAIVSSPIWNHGCCDGKREWVKKFIPEYLPRTFLGTYKAALAAQTKILVDDSDKNCEQFEAEGGKAVLVPRPWNFYGSESFDPKIIADNVGRLYAEALEEQ